MTVFYIVGYKLLLDNTKNIDFIYDNALLLLQVDVQSSTKHNEKLHAEIEELLKVKRTLEEKRGEDKELQASMSDRGGEDNDTKVRRFYLKSSSNCCNEIFIGMNVPFIRRGVYTYMLPYCVFLSPP